MNNPFTTFIIGVSIAFILCSAFYLGRMSGKHKMEVCALGRIITTGAKNGTH